ncbi:MAG: hypothetical protein PVSMB8_00370 [Vulcanimicrobiaceae bacterium]
MNATMKSNGFTMTITASDRSRNLRRVFVTMPHVAPPGVEWFSDHRGRHFEMTSFRGGPVELYVRNADGIYMYQGTVRHYAPGDELRNAFRNAWLHEQPSAAARESFELSATNRWID